MVRLIIRTIVFLAAAALGLLAAALLVDGVEVTASGFLIVVVLYAVVQSVISPFIARVAAKNASALLGGVGIIAALIALVAASLVGDSLTISGGIGTWIAATVVVWLVTALATLLLPWILVKAGVERARENRA
ncbi:hypothetical protein GA707_17665 [Nostocoides sp. F2B08]|uniref:hypothetical protein n=1 Tax=Nostocoides sp. F2B08 TaxID=2653936 RepID=UPI0012636DDC|nr:hypothetical protein [Tetrasphaera sp. F2B08]KAB7741378.1 hypothetical protein GA707_17665 [Tetrasphaera sp. F2B08]